MHGVHELSGKTGHPSWLDRRNRERKLTWAKFARLKKRCPLPLPKIYDPGST